MIGGGPGVPVVMCCWRRLHRLQRTLDLLAGQTIRPSLHIWLNDRRRAEDVPGCQQIPMSVTVSRHNVGPMGRFYLVRDLAQQGYRGPVIVIDDDQEFEPTMVEKMVADYRAGSVAAWSAFRFTGQLDRVRVQPGEPADYVVPGGMVCDPTLFLDPGVFDCPRRYWFMDDVWLSHYGQTHGWRMTGAHADFEMFNDKHDLFRSLGGSKAKMIKKLVWAHQ